MPSKRTLKKQLQEMRLDLGYALEGKEQEVVKLKDLKAKLAKANESWVREKKRADENHRLLQQAREAHQRLHEALYPGARSPGVKTSIGDNGIFDQIGMFKAPLTTYPYATDAVQDARQQAAEVYANKDRETL